MADAMAKDPRLKVQAMCGKCNTAFRVEIELLVKAQGRNYSLINKRGRCRRVNCDGRVVFMYSAGPATPFQTMTEGPPPS